jgi:hypothetical protein
VIASRAALNARVGEVLCKPRAEFVARQRVRRLPLADLRHVDGDAARAAGPLLARRAASLSADSVRVETNVRRHRV